MRLCYKAFTFTVQPRATPVTTNVFVQHNFCIITRIKLFSFANRILHLQIKEKKYICNCKYMVTLLCCGWIFMFMNFQRRAEVVFNILSASISIFKDILAKSKWAIPIQLFSNDDGLRKQVHYECSYCQLLILANRNHVSTRFKSPGKALSTLTKTLKKFIGSKKSDPCYHRAHIIHIT